MKKINTSVRKINIGHEKINIISENCTVNYCDKGES